MVSNQQFNKLNTTATEHVSLACYLNLEFSISLFYLNVLATINKTDFWAIMHLPPHVCSFPFTVIFWKHSYRLCPLTGLIALPPLSPVEQKLLLKFTCWFFEKLHRNSMMGRCQTSLCSPLRPDPTMWGAFEVEEQWQALLSLVFFVVRDFLSAPVLPIVKVTGATDLSALDKFLLLLPAVFSCFGWRVVVYSVEPSVSPDCGFSSDLIFKFQNT